MWIYPILIVGIEAKTGVAVPPLWFGRLPFDGIVPLGHKHQRDQQQGQPFLRQRHI